jgi:3-deoxy-D-manno-octulosonic acid kinase
MESIAISTAGAFTLLGVGTASAPLAAWDFDPDALSQAGLIQGQRHGRGVVYFRQASHWAVEPHAQWVLRHYRRGGLMARVNADHYWSLTIAGTRAYRELQLLLLVRALGLPAPAPIGARVRWCGGGFYQADLLTGALADTTALADLPAEAYTTALAENIAHVIKAFHRHGICHADLNARNILIDTHNRVYWIDFDRATRRAPGAWTQSNLQRLQRSLIKLNKHQLPTYGSFWSALLAAYQRR